MTVSAIRDIMVGVGHLRQQVGFYGSSFGLRVQSKGHVSEATCRSLWQVSEGHDVVTLGRSDAPDGTRLRLIRTSNLAARPDFRVNLPGPFGIVFHTEDIRRIYYRLSGTGVEFHSPPVEVDPQSEDAPGNPRLECFGRAYDGEYLGLLQNPETGSRPGTLSPYFGVTEPIECTFVVPDLEPCSRFMREVLEHETHSCERRAGAGRERALGLDPGSSFVTEVMARRGSPGARIAFLCFGDRQQPMISQPPDRGICGLRFEVDDLEERVELARELGARVLGAPVSIDDPALGQGWAVGLIAPFGILVELWTPVH